jgi:glycosyltransferase involved in cell wall biosynthesis
MLKNSFNKIAYIFIFWMIFPIVKLFTLFFKIIPLKFALAFFLKSNKRILYLDPFFAESAGTEYRIKKWIPFLEAHNYQVIIKNVYDEKKFKKLVSKGDNIIFFQVGFIVKRFFQFFYAITCKTVIVRRTVLLYNEYGQGTFMEILLNSIHPNVILDFDDDMQIQDPEKSKSIFPKILLENKGKFYSTLNKYERFIVGSEYLKNLVLRYNDRVDLNNILTIPTCVDYEKYPAKDYSDPEVITFGWIGSIANLIYLDTLIEPLNSIAKDHKIKLLVISGKDYKNESARFEIENVKWSLEKEVENLLRIDVGLMPLHNTAMEKGKCGFKLIQYMGLGLVSVASAITINKEIIDDEANGFLVYDFPDWEAVLRKVIKRKSEFNEIGAAARKKIALKYSFTALADPYIKFVTTFNFNLSFKDKLRKVLQFVSYYGYYIFFQSLYEKTRKGESLKPGITAVVSARDEEVSLNLALKSLIGFADQIVCIDNGSEDRTLELMKEFKSEYGNICDIEILSMPGALLGDCREAGLASSKHQWHLRWDADMVFKTSGEESSQKLKDKIMRTKKPIAFQLGRTNLFGDFYHCSKLYEVSDRGEPFLVRFSRKIQYKEFGKFDTIKLPIYYKPVKITDKYIFHCDGIKPDLRLIYRNCYFDWRQKFNSSDSATKKTLSDFGKFEKEWQLRKYKTNETNSLIFRYQKESLMHLKKYDSETYGAYPEIIVDHMKNGNDRFKIEYKNGKPYRRNDSANLSIQNYSPTEEDLNFDPMDYLKEILPAGDLYKLI